MRTCNLHWTDEVSHRWHPQHVCGCPAGHPEAHFCRITFQDQDNQPVFCGAVKHR